MRLRPSLAPIAVGLLAASCGGDSSPGPATTPGPELPAAWVTVQERIELSAFDAEAQADPALAALAALVTPSAAGRTEDSAGAVAHWAEGADGRTALRVCLAGACRHALAQRDGQGGATWTDATGAAVAPLSLGRPSLLKDLEGFDLAGKTVVVAAALSTGTSVQLHKDDLPGTDLTRRRFVALNTFGPAFGTPLTYVADAARAAGEFDDVVALDYVREADVARTLRDLDAMDVAVWLTQGVRQETQGGGRAFRTVALTVNRGLLGDATFDRNAVASPLALNVGGGPGLVVLAGGNTYGDGTTPPDSGSLWTALDGRGRVIVAVEGHADVSDVLRATAAFLDAWLDGETPLEAALAAGSAELASAGARLVSNQSDERISFVRHDAAIAATAPIAFSAARLSAPFTATPYCAPPGDPKTPGLSTFTTAWSDVTFDGAVFTGHRTFTSSDLTVDTTVRGVLTGFAVGDRIYLEAIGDFDKNFRAFHGFGEGVVERVDTDDSGKVTISFTGLAHAAEYTNERGDECVLNNPRLATTTSGLGKLELTP